MIEYFNDKLKFKGKSVITLDSLGRPEKKERFDSTEKLKSVLFYHY